MDTRFGRNKINMMDDPLPSYGTEFINYCRQRMTRTQFNIFMDFLGEKFIGLGNEEDYDVLERVTEDRNGNRLE